MTTEALCARILASLVADSEIAKFTPTVRAWDGDDRLEVAIRHPVTGERKTLNAGWIAEIQQDEAPADRAHPAHCARPA